MSTANAAATLEQADDFAADYAAATLTIKAGATSLAVYTLAGFVTSNSGANALATANAIATVANVGTGTATTAELTAGTKTFTLTVGTSGTDVIINDLDFITGVDSSVTGLVVTFTA